MTSILVEDRPTHGLTLLSIYHYAIVTLFISSVITIDAWCRIYLVQNVYAVIQCAFLYGLAFLVTSNVLLVVLIIMFKSEKCVREHDVLLPRLVLVALTAVGVLLHAIGLIHLVSAALSTTGLTIPVVDLIEVRHLQSRR